ncbi:MAG: SLBB domain-containing protein, partial [Candidatus Sericytochromatia bacterium]|nr:SLBB domain-containing protein [Candidatus Sericytochromatia bacterium]
MALLERVSRGLSVTFGIGLLLMVLPGNVTPVDSDTPSGQIMSGIVNVYVSGAVRKPGVYRFPVGTRTIQAIQQAGGLKPGTPAENLQLSEILRDGQSLHIDAKPTPAP